MSTTIINPAVLENLKLCHGAIFLSVSAEEARHLCSTMPACLFIVSSILPLVQTRGVTCVIHHRVHMYVCTFTLHQNICMHVHNTQKRILVSLPTCTLSTKSFHPPQYPSTNIQSAISKEYPVNLPNLLFHHIFPN